MEATASGVMVTSEYAMDGGTDGATVWFRSGNEWTRARASGTGWAIDKGPVADPRPSASRHAAGATSDGALYIGWAEDTGDFLDDRGAPYLQRLAAEASEFGASTRAGHDVDDYVSSLSLVGRGSGVVLRYCGSDVDPAGLTEDELLCFVALHSVGGQAVLRSVKESEKARYAFGPGGPAAAYCSSSLGLRSLPGFVNGGTSLGALEPLPGEVAVWPCAPLVAAEVDPDGELLMVLEHDATLVSPRPR
jgi:hypothetical protein